MSETIKIPGYRIERKLGQGGMAAVYLAIQQSFEREVALKIMSPLLNSDPSFTTRFIREARIVAHIHHASIVPVFDVGEHQPYHYLSMEYLPGGDLKQRILRGRCSTEQVVEVCIALCGALDVAHRKGFVHRDIKPENILFREDGTPVLTDFGIARAVDRGASLTVAGMLVGTPSYMSPEQVKGVELDGRSDLYSLGIVCYEMLTGTVPFRADSSMSVALKHLSESIPPLPADLAIYQPFVNSLTARDRNDRFASGSEAAQALRALQGRANTSEATMLRPMPREITEQLKKPRRRYLAPAMASVRAAAGRASAAVSSGWKARPRMPPLRTLWDKVPSPPKIDWTRPAVRWAGAASVFVVVAAVGATLALRGGGAATSPADEIASNADAAPAVVAAAPPVQPAVTPATEPAPETSITTPEDPAAADGQELVAANTADGAATTDPAAPAPDPAAEQARKRALAEQKKKRLAAQQRLAEIALEREAATRREQDEEVRNLLTAAKAAYAVGAVTQPAGDSAADRYRAVLKIRPDQPEARAGMERILNVLVTEARHAQSVGDPVALRKATTEISRLQPDHRQLPELEVALAAVESSPSGRTRREAADLEKVSRYIARSYELLGKKPFDMRAADAATKQYDLAASLVPMAPGLPTLKERLIEYYSVAVRTELSAKDSRRTQRAERMIAYARKRNWMSADLEELEFSIKQAPVVETAGAK
ncbi:MAG TPA: serine/threonine-protein kinase [Steroidobacteraceae bacterium]|nr:serine/threonine-protein kinase [Steroidobacteraceae bacterium]